MRQGKDMEELKKIIREVPDFPKKGILFYDITTLLSDIENFKKLIDNLYERYKNKEIDYVVAIDSRGFIFGSILAYKLGASLVPVRKKGKLPHKTLKATYSLEYGEDSVEIHEDAITPDSGVLLIDDLLATGGTMSAAAELIKQLQGKIVEICFIIELTFLKGREKLKDIPVYSVLKY